MNHLYRVLGKVCFALAAAVWAAPGAYAQANWPDRPIKLIVPFAPGGGVDQTARELAHRLGERFGQPVVVENRPGAGGALGVRTLISSPSDGYTFVLATAGEVAITPTLNPQIGYDPLKDLAPVAIVVRAPNVMVVHPDVPAKNLSELIAYARTKPDMLSYATSGIGTAQHLAGELFNRMTGVRIQHIPYKGSSQQVLDVIAKRVAITYASPAAVKPFMQKGQLLALGVTTPNRITTLPDVPAIGETVKGYQLESWFALFAPAGTPAAIVEKLNQATVKIVREPDFTAILRKTVGEPGDESPAEFATFLAAEVKKFAKIIADADIKLQE